MINLKASTIRLAALAGCALTLGLSVLVAASPAQARAVTAASAHLPGALFAVPVAASANTFVIVNAASSYCLGIRGGSPTPGADAVQWLCNGHPDQEWHVRSTDGSYEQFQNNDGLCLGVAGGSVIEGANVVGWTCGGTSHPDQYWAFFNSDCGGFYPLANLKSQWVLGTQGGSPAEGTPLVQWNWQKVLCNNQYWLAG